MVAKRYPVLLATRVTKSQARAIHALAKEQGVSTSELIRGLLLPKVQDIMFGSPST